MSFLYFCTIFLMFIQIEGSRSNKETSISPLCHSPSLLPSHTEIKWMRVDSVFFLYANRGFHVEICAKTRVSPLQLHSNYVVLQCRTVAEKKSSAPLGSCNNVHCANLFADWTFPRNPMHIHDAIKNVI